MCKASFLSLSLPSLSLPSLSHSLSSLLHTHPQRKKHSLCMEEGRGGEGFGLSLCSMCEGCMVHIRIHTYARQVRNYESEEEGGEKR